jgi:nitroreductase
VDRKILNVIISTTTYAPTWANFQIVRYNVVDDKDMLDKLIDEGIGFKPNITTLSNAAGAVVLSYVTGKSGCSPDGGYVTAKGDA